MNRIIALVLSFGLLPLAIGCGSKSGHESHAPQGTPPDKQVKTARAEQAHPADLAKPLVPTNRVDVPASVRANLGIVFRKAQLRAVQRTLRLPGRFELKPTATRTYHAPLAGGVEFAVKELERVTAGQLLATVRAPELRERQHKLHKAEHEIRRAKASWSLLNAQLSAAKRRGRFLRKRAQRLSAASVRRASLEQSILQARTEVRLLKIRVDGARAEITRERHHRVGQLRELSDATGLSIPQLKKPIKGHAARAHRKRSGGHGHAAHWDRLSVIELRAKSDGIVSRIGLRPGAWAARGATVVEVTDERQLRFVATALQGDIGRIRSGAQAAVVPGSVAPAQRRGEVLRREKLSIGTVQLGLVTDATRRTLPVIIRLKKPPTWARAGASAFAEVVVAGPTGKEVAIPRDAVVRDGLHDVFFRRDPKNLDKVIRVEADLGSDDGRWVTVFSDVNVGDEVVVAGAYELKLASSKRSEIKGHFHADGSFHAGPEDD
ncbi:MAG: HlyD family efflux transporter periplasmic adaptor subunit [Myxococcales bacterium]|nr:HlyD family efflux transporter periplasmic adaptor subunit [Myxococcales bacterium]